MEAIAKYRPKNSIRIVTATSLFDGHDVAINIMRRIMQACGVEVIHLGHNRKVREIVDCAVQEDAHAVAVTSYQGGHLEFFKYMRDELQKRDCAHIRIFGGGGGVILPREIELLHDYGIERIYSPDDGKKMGLQGMVNDLLKRVDHPSGKELDFDLHEIRAANHRALARAISALENYPQMHKELFAVIKERARQQKTAVLGITGTGGAGKSSLVDDLVHRFCGDFPGKTIGIISIDPSNPKSGGALLGDRIRMNAIGNPQVFTRSMATRQSHLALSSHLPSALAVLKAAGFDLIIIETSGIGQSDTEITEHCDLALYVMTPEYGAATQLEKIAMFDFADMIVLNKFDKVGAPDALTAIKKQFAQSRELKPEDDLPVFTTIASRFNDAGVNRFYASLVRALGFTPSGSPELSTADPAAPSADFVIIPSQRIRYLSEVSETVRKYNSWVTNQCETASRLHGIKKTLETLKNSNHREGELAGRLETLYESLETELDQESRTLLAGWKEKTDRYRKEEYRFKVRDREFVIATHTETLSHLRVPKVSVPKYRSWPEILAWSLKENFPGEFPYTSGVFPFRREAEDPTRMFAGEGGPERTNKRFHYLSRNMPARRLSTAFDSITLYGEDPDSMADVYGKIGTSGVSICCLDDMKKLYSGFNLLEERTSVSMTINGPAPVMVAFFMNTAIDQQCELYIRQQGLTEEVRSKIEAFYGGKDTTAPRYQGDLPPGNDGLGLLLLGTSGDQVLPAQVYENIKAQTLKKIRGTIQADILKEDQAQNTCIFSINFSLKMMGDLQEYFILHGVRNFYSVSISGYHIAEAGANPITQLAFTLANGLTYLEYYLARGMKIDEFAPNLSFFFSNGLDPEYSVIGRVARRIWAVAMKLKYNGNGRSQKLKYHIQTSGRSLHAQEIQFNDIRTTLQALYAINDNCNSLHTNAYDEAITTPTEESVRRALAIQLIINRELGIIRNQNPMQGSFIIEELTDMVEAAVLAEFDRLTQRGGVLGAMETMYQRNRIQDESYFYETRKLSGELPVVGVNTFLSPDGSPFTVPGEVIRATEEEKKNQLENLKMLHRTHRGESDKLLANLKKEITQNKNIFESLMESAKICSLGQITSALYAVGGQYRRNM